MLSQHGADHWSQAFTAAGVPCGPVNGMDEAFALAERLGLDPIKLVDGVRTVAHPIALSKTPARYDLRPPGVGDSDISEVL